MSYEKQTWENQVTPINAERLNHIEEGIAEVDTSKLDKMVVSKYLSTPGWYRVAKYNNVCGKSFLVNITTKFNTVNNMAVTLAVNITIGKAKITNIASNVNNVTVTKVRVVTEGNDVYLEIYYSPSTNNGVYVDIVNQNSGATGTGDLSMLNFEAPTDTATVLDELLITQDELEVSSLLQNSWEKHSDCQIFKNNNTVHVGLCIKNGSAQTVLQLPAGYRPSGLLYFPLNIDGEGGSYCWISTDGVLKVSSASLNKLLFINFSYKV